MSVSATDSNDNKASFSNYGSTIDIAAPGVSIYSTMPTYHVTLNDKGYSKNYAYLSGTSMACPYVSGLAALILSRNLLLTNDEVEQIIIQSADDIGAVGWDQYFGYGRINAFQALDLTPSPTPLPPSLSDPSPANGSVDVELNPCLSVNVSDPDGDLMNVTFLTNASGPVTQTWYFDNFSFSNWTHYLPRLVDEDNNSAALSNGRHRRCFVLDSNTCNESDLGVISKVELVALVSGTSGNPSLWQHIIYRLIPVFNGVSGDVYSYEWSVGDGRVWFSCDITGDSGAPSVWSWGDVVGLGCEFWDWEHDRESSMCGYGYRVGVRVTYSNWTVIGVNSSVSDGRYSQIPTNMDDLETMYWWAVVANDGLNSSRAVYHFTTTSTPSSPPPTSSPPNLSNPIPSNGSVDVELNPCLSVNVSDPDGDLMNVTFLTNASGPVTQTWYFDNFSFSNWTHYLPRLVDEDNNSAALSNGRHRRCFVLDSNTCNESDLGVISKVELVALVSGTSGNPSLWQHIIYRLIPVFNGVSGDVYSYEWSVGDGRVWFSCDITGDSGAPSVWSWGDVVGLGCEFWDWEHDRESSMCGYGYRVGVRVTYSNWTVIGVNNSVNDGQYSQIPIGMDSGETTYYWSVIVDDGILSTQAIYHFTTKSTP